MRILHHLNLHSYPHYIPQFFADKFELDFCYFSHTPFANDRENKIFLGNNLNFIQYFLEEKLNNSYYIKQYHSAEIQKAHVIPPKADAHYLSGWLSGWPMSPLVSANQKNLHNNEYLSIKTADCLPIALCYQRDGVFIGAAVHAGWKGLTAGILKMSIAKLLDEASFYKIEHKTFLNNLYVHIGPAIFGQSYECRSDIKESFLVYKEKTFEKFEKNKWIANLYDRLLDFREEGDKFSFFPDLQLIAALELVTLNIHHQHIDIFRENTYTHPTLTSFRRATHHKLEKIMHQWLHLKLPFKA